MGNFPTAALTAPLRFLPPPNLRQTLIAVHAVTARNRAAALPASGLRLQSPDSIAGHQALSYRVSGRTAIRAREGCRKALDSKMGRLRETRRHLFCNRGDSLTELRCELGKFVRQVT